MPVHGARPGAGRGAVNKQRSRLKYLGYDPGPPNPGVTCQQDFAESSTGAIRNVAELNEADGAPPECAGSRKS